MKRTIRTCLSPASLERAIREIQNYRIWFQRKTLELSERLAVYGASVVSARFSGAWYEEDHKDVAVDAHPSGNGWAITAQGKDVFFIEFGAGVYYNGSEPYPQPRPPEVSGIGQYGKGKGKQKSWGYLDDGGSLRITHGTPAAMPMWQAQKEIRQNLVQIAREVFAS